MPQSGGDLVSAGYPTSNPVSNLLGGLANATQPNLPARSNLYYPLGNVTASAACTSGAFGAAAIPVSVGDTISKITIFVGAAASTPTHSYLALYSGIAVPALLAQSTDTTTTVIAASGSYTVTLATPVTITATNAPNGFVYAAICQTATTPVTAASLNVPTAVGYAWSTSGPLGFCISATGAAATAPATLASISAAATAPVFALT